MSLVSNMVSQKNWHEENRNKYKVNQSYHSQFLKGKKYEFIPIDIFDPSVCNSH